MSSVSSVVDYSYLQGSSLVSGYTSIAGVSPALSVSYDFEDNRDAKTQVLNEFGTNLVSQFDYTYDALMRRTQRKDVRYQGSEVSTNTFGYNTRSELTNAVMSGSAYSYQYDSIGNRVDATFAGVTAGASRSLSYTANSLNQYTQITDNSVTNNCTYDADGNLLSDGTSTYTWNGENRLIEVSNATTVVTFKYDHQGRRFEKTVNVTNTTQFVYDGWNLIVEDTGSATNAYVWGLDLSQSLQDAGGVGGLLAQITDNGSTVNCSYAVGDANGNVTDYVTTNGTIVAHYEYDAYGNIVTTEGTEAQSFVFRFSTKYQDLETGLSYYGFRYYSPEMGRWINRDPIAEQGGLNLYAFIANNPGNNYDGLGLSGADCPCTAAQTAQFNTWKDACLDAAIVGFDACEARCSAIIKNANILAVSYNSLGIPGTIAMLIQFAVSDHLGDECVDNCKATRDTERTACQSKDCHDYTD